MIAEVPNNPFVADLVESGWENSSGGAKRSIDLRDADGLMISASLKPQIVGIVARDSAGRVFFRRLDRFPKLDSSGKPIEGSRSDSWHERVCNPETNEIAIAGCGELLSHSSQTIASDSATTLLNAACGHGAATVQRHQSGHTSASFAYWHNQVKGREDLGLEMFEGVPAYRYRLTLTRRDHSLHEVVISDELLAQLSQVSWHQFPGSELEQRLANIRRNEPDPRLFETPDGITGEWITAPRGD